MPEIVSIEYVPRKDVPIPPTVYGPHGEVPQEVLFGGYHVKWDDGYQVLMPHVGYHATVSAEPLDPDDEEHREILAGTANAIREVST